MNNVWICLLLLIASHYCILHAQPKLEVIGGKNMDFGDVYSGSKATRTIALKNVGTDTLNIAKVTASCGCTAALASSQHVAPNDTASLAITFNSGMYRGKLTKSVTVLSNDSIETTINFTVNIKTVLESIPQFLYFKKVKVDSPVTKSFRLKNTTSVSITILKVVSKDSQLTVQLRQNKLGPGEETELEATLTPKKTGYIQGGIELTTDFNPYPLLLFSFNGYSSKGLLPKNPSKK